jgi:hypothetical protein
LKRSKVIAIFVIAIFAVSLILVAYDSYRNTQVDTSWVETANNMLKDYPSFINVSQLNDPSALMMTTQLHLIENGTDGLLHFGSEDNLTKYLINLLKQASIQKGTISQEQLNKILASGKAVEITFRFFLEVPPHHYNPTYFIVESNQNQGLSGAIIVKDGQSPTLNILAVSKLPKFP